MVLCNGCMFDGSVHGLDESRCLHAASGSNYGDGVAGLAGTCGFNKTFSICLLP